MARPREFEEHAVIADALQAFWKQGYGATSIPDLFGVTGLERGSLYKAFKDKRSLFDRALSVYLQSGRAGMKETFRAAGSPLQRLMSWARASRSRVILSRRLRGTWMFCGAASPKPDSWVDAKIVTWI
jgi:TetR/AcrR family transcriptional repressor of nem operon